MSLTILLEPKSHVVLENKVPFQHNYLNLPKTSNFENDIGSLASYPFPEIELENEYDPEPQLSDSILLPDSIMTLVSSPDFSLFPSQHWILCQFIMKLNHPSLMIIKLNHLIHLHT